MELIDLHVHSNISDGTLSPEELVAVSCAKGLTAFALTDHDTIDGISRAVSAAEDFPLEVIPGTELSCLYGEKEIHILGLYVDHHSEQLKKELAFQKFKRDQRNEEMLNRFAKDGMTFTIEDLQEGNPGTVITRAHFSRVLVEKGYATSINQAFKKYLDHGLKYCPPKAAFTPEEAIRLIVASGGFPAIAHPMMYKMGWKEIETMIAEFTGFGLMGLEVYYSSHRIHESMRLQELCKTYGLLPTGGSDFHGSNKPDIDIGSGRGGLRVSALLLKDIKSRLP